MKGIQVKGGIKAKIKGVWRSILEEIFMKVPLAVKVSGYMWKS